MRVLSTRFKNTNCYTQRVLYYCTMTTFSFGFSGDDIEDDESADQEPPIPVTNVKATTSALPKPVQPQKHNVKGWVCCLRFRYYYCLMYELTRLSTTARYQHFHRSYHLIQSASASGRWLVERYLISALNSWPKMRRMKRKGFQMEL